MANVRHTAWIDDGQANSHLGAIIEKGRYGSGPTEVDRKMRMLVGMRKAHRRHVSRCLSQSQVAPIASEYSIAGASGLMAGAESCEYASVKR